MICPRVVVNGKNDIFLKSAAMTLPPRKRIRLSQQSARLFVPFRALGLFTNHVPFKMQSRSFKGASDGPRLFLLTCLGDSWALWEGGKMTLLFVGPSLPASITSLAMDGDSVWVTSASTVYQYIRGKEVLCLAHLDLKLQHSMVADSTVA